MDYTIFINAGIATLGLVVVNYGAKLGRIAPILKDIYEIILLYEESKRDGKLNQKEKADLYDKISLSLKDAWIILKGFTPFK